MSSLKPNDTRRRSVLLWSAFDSTYFDSRARERTAWLFHRIDVWIGSVQDSASLQRAFVVYSVYLV